MPRSLTDIDVAEPYNVTLCGDLFLQDDTGREDPNRILIFVANFCLTLLAMTPILFGDGTFKTVPEQFMQMYTLHGIVEGFVLPLAFALCVRKNLETYEHIFSVIKNLAEEKVRRVWSPGKVMMDFEQAAMRAVRLTFPSAVLRGGLFHLNQALWRNVVSNGLRDLYENVDDEDHTVREDIQKLMALPCVPLGDVEEVFDAIVEDFDDRVLTFSTYMESTWIRGHRQLHRNRRSVPPLFPKEV